MEGSQLGWGKDTFGKGVADDDGVVVVGPYRDWMVW